MDASTRSARVAFIGTRGVPARYGGFETAIEEVGRRLADRGHNVTVYCRTPRGVERLDTHHGMRLVHLPSVPSKALETLTHTGVSTIHALLHRRHDVAFVFNSANAPFVPFLQWRGMPVAVHVDGLEWRRGKWGRNGRNYYRRAEALSVRRADALIADAPGIADYYAEEFGAPTDHIAYGAPILHGIGDDLGHLVGLDQAAHGAGRRHVGRAGRWRRQGWRQGQHGDQHGDQHGRHVRRPA
jgi:glycosyltransferase involved in cell wall biosynthesis